MQWVQPKVARKADRVIVPSEATARDVVAELGVQREQIRIVPYGPGNEFHPLTDAARIDAALAKYNVRRPYIVSVCRAYVHKNLAGLLRAYAELRKRGHGDVQLVLIGEPYRTGDALRAVDGGTRHRRRRSLHGICQSRRVERAVLRRSRVRVPIARRGIWPADPRSDGVRRSRGGFRCAGHCRGR